MGCELIAENERYMARIHQLLRPVLPQNDAGHMISLVDEPADDEIIIREMLHQINAEPAVASR